MICSFFFFNDTATTEIYTLSLHDALPIWPRGRARRRGDGPQAVLRLVLSVLPRPRSLPATRHDRARTTALGDRKSTRLNSSHANISYAVFCLKKKKKNT